MTMDEANDNSSNFLCKSADYGGTQPSRATDFIQNIFSAP